MHSIPVSTLKQGLVILGLANSKVVVVLSLQQFFEVDIPLVKKIHNPRFEGFVYHGLLLFELLL